VELAAQTGEDVSGYVSAPVPEDSAKNSRASPGRPRGKDIQP
jgi:hypothetical protein